MNAQELYEEWMQGEQPGMRPKRVQALRDDLARVTGLPVPRRVPEIEGWLDSMRESGVLTKKLRAAAEDDGDVDDGEE